MNPNVRSIADAVLYEGYMLYPYRPSSVKNRQRWTFGGLFPEGWHSDPSCLHAELLLTGNWGSSSGRDSLSGASDHARQPIPPEVLPPAAAITVQVRFLHLLSLETERGTWQEAMEREVIVHGASEQRFHFPSWRKDGRRQEQVDGIVALSVEALSPGLWKMAIHVANLTEFTGSEHTTRDEASLQALIATHAIAEVSGGDFISLTDPPEQYREVAAACSNVGVWPVMAGDEGSRDCMLASPIILSDYPQIAPESPGDLFDGGEIDEILTLRIMAMTDEEKAEMRAADERTRRLLERTESLAPDQLMKLHGVLRNPHTIGRGR